MITRKHVTLLIFAALLLAMMMVEATHKPSTTSAVPLAANEAADAPRLIADHAATSAAPAPVLSSTTSAALAENTTCTAATSPSGLFFPVVLSNRNTPFSSAAANVLPPVAPLDFADSIAFLYTGANRVQTAMTAATIDPERAAVLRGQVCDAAGRPIAGVRITILDHPEYGNTLTQADGVFDLVVNGGGSLTVNYQKNGYLPVQRPVQAPWQDYAWLPEIVMIALDPNVTTIDLTANIPIQVARGSVISDADGKRQETLLFPLGTTAVMTLTNGTTQALTTLSVRSTEYTVGPNGLQRMPGELPDNVAYTYATEFSADEAVAAGAVGLGFSRPIISYNENFLNFPVGTVVPMGYYDSSRGVWVSSDNGRVVRILSINGGIASLDVDGSGQPASAATLATLGVTVAERTTLTTLYTVGQSLWRTPLKHFSSWDKNMATSCQEPCPDPDRPEPDSPDLDEPDIKCSSIIGCQNQTLGEVIELTGTPFYLRYESSRVRGYGATSRLRIPLSGPDVSSTTLKRIYLEVEVAGQVTRRSFPAAPNLSYLYVWNGRDAYGRILQGRQPITVRLSYAYPLVYQATERFGYNGNASLSLDASTQRAEFTITKVWQGTIGGWDASQAQGLGGWSLNIHHVYDARGKVLYLGNGERRSEESLNFNVITTVAGNGIQGYAGDGGPASQAQLSSPRGVAVGPDGSVYIATTGDDRIRRVAPSGVITTVAGNGSAGYSGDGGPATQAQLFEPSGLAVGQDGSLYIADSANHRIRRVGADGIITTIAGNGTGGYSGDGGLATEARMNGPRGVAVSQDGNLYIADGANQRIRRVGVDGIITTIAGNGGSVADGDGGPATQAGLGIPTSVAIGPNGSLYIATPNNYRIRRVGTDGIITTVAGDGTPGYSGDDDLAVDAQLRGPIAIAGGQDGSLFITDQGNYVIRQVLPDGIITTLVGNGSGGYSGDGGPAARGQLYLPYELAVGPDGALYIADDVNYRIRRVASSLGGAALAFPAEDGSEVYIFNDTGHTGRHLRTLHGLTGETLYAFNYDNSGRLVSVDDGDGNRTTITRDSSGNPTGIVGPFGQTTTFTLDANGYLASITNPAQEVVQLGYTAGGLLTSLVDPRGNAQTFEYDEQGLLIRDVNAAAGFMELGRLSAGQTYTVTLSTALDRITTYHVQSLPNGDQRRVETSPNGLQSESLRGMDGTRSERAPDGTTTAAVLGPDPRWGMLAPIAGSSTVTTPGGLAATVTEVQEATLTNPLDPFSLTALDETLTVNGRAYTSHYTAATQTFTNTSPEGRQLAVTIDDQGRPLLGQIAGLQPSSYTYDSRGRLTSATQGSGANARAVTFAYNSKGYLATITDPLGRTVSLSYDNAGRVTEQTLPDGRIIGYGYDANGNLTRVTPPGRPAHTFAYTPLDLVSAYTPPDVLPGTDETRYAYNLDRQLTTITRPDGQTIAYGYDSAGRLDGLTIARGTIGYSYDPATGNLAGITAPGGIGLAYAYDGPLLTGETWSGPVAGSTGYTYDNDFRISASMVNGGNPITYQYDDDSLLVQAGSLTLSHDAQNGLLSGSTLGNVSDTWVYNGFAEATDYTASYNAAALYDVAYTRDELGRITQKVEAIGGATTTFGYSYDLAGRLIGVTQNGSPIAAYTYDSNGNRLTFTGPGGTVTGSYDNQDRLLQYGANSYTYTANGELLTKRNGSQTTRYDYDEFGNLLGVTLPDGTEITYLIDGQNRRIGKQVNGTLMQGFLYDGQLRIVAELDSAGNIVSRFIYATHVNVPDYMIKAGVTYRIVTDQLGSPRLVVNIATGVITQSLNYDAFGVVLTDTNPGFQPFGFAGGLYERDTKLVHFGARDYDAESGRWTTKDPIAYTSTSTNLYTYVSNDPVNRIDHFGLSADLIIIPREQKTYQYAKRITPPTDELIVVIHGYQGGPLDENRQLINPADLARRIREIQRYKSTKSVRLISCNVGAGRKYPQALANYLNKPVWAPTSYGEVRSDGTYGVQNPGRWVQFNPTGDPPLSPLPKPEIKLGDD